MTPVRYTFEKSTLGFLLTALADLYPTSTITQLAGALPRIQDQVWLLVEFSPGRACRSNSERVAGLVNDT